MPRSLHVNQHGSTSPTIAAAQTSAGVSSVAVSTDAGDQVGSCTITTGTTAAAGNLATVTFGQAYRAAPKAVFLTHNADNSGATAVELRVSSIATNSFVIATPSTPANSKAYSVAYLVAPADGE